MRKAISHLKNSDPVLRTIIQKAGAYRIRYLEPDFDMLAKSVVYQQLSGKAARTIYHRLVALSKSRQLEPDAVLRLSEEQFRQAGISRQKRQYLLALAQAASDGAVDFARMPDLPDEEVLRLLTALPGIGVWTVQMFLIFGLRRPDVLPSADLGIRNAIVKAYGLSEPPKPKAIDAMGEPWRPYRSVASWYLWRSLEDDPGM